MSSVHIVHATGDGSNHPHHTVFKTAIETTWNKCAMVCHEISDVNTEEVLEKVIRQMRASPDNKIVNKQLTIQLTFKALRGLKVESASSSFSPAVRTMSECQPSTPAPPEKWLSAITKLSRTISFLLRHAEGNLIDDAGCASIRDLLATDQVREIKWAKAKDIMDIGVWAMNGKNDSDSLRITPQ